MVDDAFLSVVIAAGCVGSVLHSTAEELGVMLSCSSLGAAWGGGGYGSIAFSQVALLVAALSGDG